jgi:hypothetical protein
MGYFSWDMPLWEKFTWVLLGFYIFLVMVIYWVFGWSVLLGFG